MCWACYTPLTGAAGAGASLAGASAAVGTMPRTAGAPVGVPSSEDDSKKKGVDPKLIGVGAFLVVAGLAAFFITGAMGGSSEVVVPESGVDPNAPAMMVPAPPPPPAAIPQFSAPGGGGGGPAPAPVPLPFKTVTPPNPQFETGTMGILVAPNVSATQAAGFARFARDQISRNGKWNKMQIAVFTSQAAADGFASYQSTRRGAPLTTTDFVQLGKSGVWNGSPAFIESRGKQEKIFTPSSSPTMWWQRR